MERAALWTCRRVSYTINRADMNPRRLSEKVDDGIMGEIASVAFMQHLQDRGRDVIAYDDIRRDEAQEPDPGWDVLVAAAGLAEWAQETEDPRTPPAFAHSFSIKSSRIPAADADDIAMAIARRDFKIFKKANDIAADLSADYESQGYFELARSTYRPDLVVSGDSVGCLDLDAVLKGLEIEERYGRCFLIGVANRDALVKYSYRLPASQRTWSSWHAGHEKAMWTAPLRLGRSLAKLSRRDP
jgi:hypothetical protein